MRASAAVITAPPVQCEQLLTYCLAWQVLGIYGQQCCKHVLKLPDLCRRERKCRQHWREPCRFKALQWQQ